MKLNRFLLFGVGAAIGLTGCIDDKYDLSNINSQSQFLVNDLILPIQMDPVVLSDIITTEEGDKLKEVTINGQTFYAVEDTGDFNSDPINIKKINASPSEMTPTIATFNPKDAAAVNGKRASDTQKLYLLIAPVNESLDYEANVDASVRTLTNVYYSHLNFQINFKMQVPASGLTSELENVVMEIPKGLSLTSVSAPGYTYSKSDYNPTDGILKLSKINLDSEGKASIIVTSNAIDLTVKGNETAFTPGPKGEEGRFFLDSDFNVLEADMTISASASVIASLTQPIIFDIDYNMEQLSVESIMGNIEYNLEGEGLNIAPIEITDLPDFLNNDETNLILANPQIYLSLNNPVNEYGLGYQSGLDIIATREDSNPVTFTLDEMIEVKASDAETDNFVLAPDPNAIKNVPEEFAEGLKGRTFSSLGNILSGAGLPNSLDINLIEPEIEEQPLTSPLPLGINLEGMKGNYRFLAPLALDGQSLIIYSETKDGWYSDDLQYLTINVLTLNTVATNDIPLDATLTITPIDKDGKVIPNVKCEPLVLAAKTSNVPMTFVLTGDITNLDGVKIYARVIPDGSEETLTPNQYITLDNIRVKVSGKYERNF